MNKGFRFLFFLAFYSLACLTSFSQTASLEYISELHTDFKDNYNFLNLLKLSAEYEVSKHFAFKASSISFAKTRNEPVIEDLQVYSNIDVDNLPFAFAILGAEWRINDENTLFVGIHNVNEDCFASDVTSLFTNSSCGIYPTIGNNYPIANYPVASLGMHYKYDGEHFGAVASLYNGVGNTRIAGRENVFRFCPKSDGLFGLVQGEYKLNGNEYFIGGCLHYGELDDVKGHKVRTSLWAYAEQAVTENLKLIGGYSHAFHACSPCKDFVGFGGKYTLNNVEIGLFSDYAHFIDNNEWATELTCKAQLSEHIYLQPTLHYIKNNEVNRVVGLLRLGVEY